MGILPNIQEERRNEQNFNEVNHFAEFVFGISGHLEQ